MSREHDALTHLLEAWFDTDGDDGDAVRVMDATLDQLPVTPQRPASFWGMRNIVSGLAVAATVVVAVIGFQLLPDASPAEPIASPLPTVVEPTPLLPALRMPGMGRNGAHDYGWTGFRGASAWMHRVAGYPGQAQIVFAVAHDCFASGEGPEPVPMKIAGYEALRSEPYSEPGLMLLGTGNTISANSLNIDGRNLCVYLAWDAETTAAGLEALRDVLESIRGQAFDETGIRIVFTLDANWDTG
jgi:hypothetical protein